MCGIAGIYQKAAVDLFSDSPIKEVEKMLSRIKHRGPDATGLHQSGPAIHGHVRLSLVDLSSQSDQPFLQDGSVLSFNGEIWNFRELKSSIDYDFKTTSDTEVLIALLNQKGLCCLPELDGMFAFAYSSKSGDHYLVRDRHGKIPVYYRNDNGSIKWASERKAFEFGEEVFALPPGSYMNLKTGSIVQWYDMPNLDPLDKTSTIQLLRQGVEKRMQLDADLCCLISGGIDSSLILAMAKEFDRNVTAFTAVFDKRSTDLLAARKLCNELDVRLIEVEISEIDIKEAIRTIEICSKAQIEIASLCIPLARRISEEGFKACLSGEAADELFGGYGNFCIRASKCKSDQEVFDLRFQQLRKMSRGNFIRCNKAFMAHGVECRLPFMEDELVERAMKSNLIDSPSGKKLLKQAAAGIVPEFIVKRQKETFQGSANVTSYQREKLKSPTKTYNYESRIAFGYRPTE